MAQIPPSHFYKMYAKRIEILNDMQLNLLTIKRNKMNVTSSKTLRAERRAKKIKIIEDSLLYGFFALIAIGMLWIIQVGVTSI